MAPARTTGVTSTTLTSTRRGTGGPGLARKTAKPRKGAKKKKLSRLRKPEDMSLEAWQVALRREFGREQRFRLKNIGNEPIFSEFEVTNPQTERTYRVAVRGQGLGENYCSCPDFTVNTLGTCKHVEFALARLAKLRGGKTALALGFQPRYSQVYLQYGAQREVIFRPGTECPAAFKTYAQRFFDAQGRLLETAYAEFPEFLKKATASQHEVRCYDDAVAMVAEHRDRASLSRRIDETFGKGQALDKLVKAKLYPYQREGALFAAKAGRCLLADDMGLGKTIQAIAAAEILARSAGVERVLIVAPTSLKHQWRAEIQRFIGCDALVVEGLLPRRAELYRADAHFKITNYDVIHRDMDAIRRWQPELIILDEAQRIKNWKTRTAQSVKQLESEYAFVLTGTPLENRLEELHSIVEFVDRFRLGPMFRFLSEHQHVDECGRVVGYRQLGKISQTLAPILVRRTKDKVLKELPERIEKRFFVPMTPQQMDHHEENRKTVAQIVQKWRRFGFLREADQRRMQIALQFMRMSCNSTYLLDQSTDHGTKANELVDVLSDMLERPDAKVVLFSQWLRMHELVVRRLESRRWEHVLFHGGVPGPKRKDLVRRFKDDPACRLFLSTDAGGVGLNLQNASAVVNLDQPWNPAVLEQRIGRVHRLGQSRPVQVVHFIAQGTIEEGMLALLAFKKSMFTGVLDGGANEVFMGGTRLKRFMESVESATGSIPASMPRETQQDEEERRSPSTATEPLPTPQEDAWSDVLSAGMSLLEKFSRAISEGERGSASATRAASAGLPSPLSSLVASDPQTGKPYLKLPMPEPETVEKLVGLVAALAKGIRG